MNPAFCKSLRSEAISRCKLPGLTIELSVSSKTHGMESLFNVLFPFLAMTAIENCKICQFIGWSVGMQFMRKS